MAMSCTSALVLVMPHAIRWLCPSTTNGTLGIVTPITSSPAATRCISHHTDGNSICKCGSLARIGRPLFVRRGASTQLLLLPRRALADSHSRPVGSGLLEPRATGYVMLDAVEVVGLGAAGARDSRTAGADDG